MTKFFRPKEDISAYEAAFLLAHIASSPRTIWQSPIEFTERQWSEVPEAMQRHFKDTAAP